MPNKVIPAGTVKPDKMGCEEALENAFESLGRGLARRPWTSLLVACFVSLGLAYGFATVKSETRPEQQWVARGAPALEQNEYVKENWPSNQRFNFFIARCKTDGCNVLEPKYLKELQNIQSAIMDVVVDGDAIVADMVATYPKEDKAIFKDLAGKWSFQSPRDKEGNKIRQDKCFKAGNWCLKRSILDVFKDDASVMDSMSDDDMMRGINFWEDQQNMCPLTVTRADSPCVDTTKHGPPGSKPNDCQLYGDPKERNNCREAARTYCNNHCPMIDACGTMVTATAAALPKSTQQQKLEERCKAGEEVLMPDPKKKCLDEGCMTLQGFERIEDMSSSTGNGTAPESAFAWAPFELSSVLGGIEKGSNGDIVSAKAFFSFYSLSFEPVLIAQKGNSDDPVSKDWEKQALCVLGIDTENRKAPRGSSACPQNDLFDFDINFARSLSDEFGGAIMGDLIFFIVGALTMIVYLGLMLSERDPVHSMIGMSFVTVLVVGFAYAGGVGLGGFFGIKNNNLNQIIPFLILGLGVDDAFVLTAEFNRASRQHPEASVEDRIALAAKHGGLSILITSATDALAFLIGSMTVLPALGWFCQFSGISVILCFLLQLFIFLPALAINAKRAEANRYDVLCCFKSRRPHLRDNPRGCCGCILPGKWRGLAGILRDFGGKITTLPGKAATIVLFLALLGAGVGGMTQLYKDFKLEWFIPDDSYVRDFFAANEEMFASGERFTVYTGETDYFQEQQGLHDTYHWLNTSGLIDQGDGIDSWYAEFMDATRTAIHNDAMYANDRAAQSKSWLSPKTGLFTDKKVFYTQLHEWYSGGGARYRSAIQWKDADCSNSTDDHYLTAACNPMAGIKGTRQSATIALAHTERGFQQYDTMVMLRNNITEFLSEDAGGFPYSFQFLYWEEMGVIDAELVRNLLICGAVILVMIALMIPRLRISVWVAVCIIMSIVDVVGCLHWWGVTISGVSTIYILISVGLAVDYSAHIAHMFKESKGTSEERAIEALGRIGPSVLNAVISTFLAVVVMSTSKSYIFRIFFKALFLVTVIAGAHGLILLPVLLALFGGNNGSKEDEYGGPSKPGVVVAPSGGDSAESTEDDAAANGGAIVAVDRKDVGENNV